MIRRREGQFGIMDREIAALEVEQAARTAEIVQQMAIDMEQVGIVADMGDNMLVPDFGQQRSGGFFQGIFSVWLLRPAARATTRRFARLAIQAPAFAISKHGRPLFG
jgi:hypothetical protein